MLSFHTICPKIWYDWKNLGLGPYKDFYGVLEPLNFSVLSFLIVQYRANFANFGGKWGAVIKSWVAQKKVIVLKLMFLEVPLLPPLMFPCPICADSK